MTLAVTHQDSADGTFSATGATNWNKTHTIGGLGTGVETALGVNVGSAGAPVVNGGALGTPSTGVATNLTGTAADLTAGTVTTNANLTGPITSSGNATAVASQTGTGSKFVMDTSPALITPALGTPASGVLTNCTGLPLAGNGSIANIQGREARYNSGTVIRVLAGTTAVNNKVLSAAQTDYTSGSTMKDLANATVTLAASTGYFGFDFDNAGTLTTRFEKCDGTGDGADPTFTTAVDYWIATDTGIAARRIFKFWTDGSANIRPFTVTNLGRHRIYNLNDCESLVLVNGVAQASYTAITISPYITGDDAEMLVGVGVFAASLNTNGGIRISNDGGTGQIAVLYSSGGVSGGNVGMSDLKETVPNTQDLRYLTINSATGYVFLMGYSQWV